MNCAAIEQCYPELALLIDGKSALTNSNASEWRAAQAHLASCAACAQRWEAEQALTRAFANLRSDDLPVQATARVKRDLLAAFAAQTASTGANIASSSAPILVAATGNQLGNAQNNNVLPFAARQLQARHETATAKLSTTLWRRNTWQSGGGRTAMWWLAAAAFVLLGLFGAFWGVVWRGESTVTPSQQAQQLAIPSTANVNQTPVIAIPSPASIDRGETNPAQVTARAPAQRVRALLARATRQVNRAAKQRESHAGSELKTQPLTASAAPFIPLTYTADEKELQNGLLVRVELTRDTLLAMGLPTTSLPMDAQRSAERIKADVMMGENGVTYAIRLVND